MKQTDKNTPEVSDEPWGLFGSVYLSFIASHLDSHAGGGKGGKKGDAIDNNPKRKKEKNITAFIWILNKCYLSTFVLFLSVIVIFIFLSTLC